MLLQKQNNRAGFSPHTYDTFHFDFGFTAASVVQPRLHFLNYFKGINVIVVTIEGHKQDNTRALS